MKKVTKMSLRDLAKEMPVLSELEQSAFIGGDTLIFDKKGHYVKTIEDGNSYRTVNVEGVDSSSGVILDSSTTFSSYEYKDQETENVATGFMFSNVSIELFELFAKQTDVEWSYSYNEDEKGTSSGMLNTTHQEGGVQGLYYSGFDSLVHNHPNGNTGYSSWDENAKAMAERRYDYENFYTFINEGKKGSYNPY